MDGLQGSLLGVAAMNGTFGTAFLIASVFALLMLWKWGETAEHIACINSGGDVVLGWFQDGCTTHQ